jgi:hypothetical protein
MTTSHAIRYREKARELFKAAALASTDQLRDQFANLALQYEILAARMEGLADADQPEHPWPIH